MTNIPNALVKTDQTYETDPVSNQEFLETVFGAVKGDVRPIVVSFKGNPNKIKPSGWFGKKWDVDQSVLSDDANNYFSIAAFCPTEDGLYRRQKKYFVTLHAIVLDDIGTKISQERLTLSPSWMLETSSGNFQVGYILAEPLQDAAIADKFMKAVIQAQLCDPGAGGPTSRLVRLPVGVNGKYAPAFQCQMKSWKPDIRYSVDDLVNGLELDMQSAGRPKSNGKKNRLERPEGNDEIFVACPTDNIVLTTLRARGLYKSPLGSGKHDITCPWVVEHTNAANGGTAYFEPDDNFPIGGFKCLHGHCEHRHIRDFLAVLSIEPAAARMKATIRSMAGEVHRLADKAEQELAKSGKYYQRGGLIVAISTDPGIKDTSVKEISQPALMAALSCSAMWERYDSRTQDYVRIDPPARVVSVLFDSLNYRHLPVLNGLAHQPYLRPDGTLVNVAGYDLATGMFGVFNANKFDIPDKPTKEDAVKALNLITDLLAEFSFPKKSDEAAAITAILAASIRPSLTAAPMYHVRAPQISSGKSFLCQIIGAFATPKRGAPTTFPYDDEECRKVLLAELLRAPAIIEFDNMTTDLVAHKSLCTALTSEYITGRIFGVSKTATVSTRTLFLSSGNNVGPIQDMVRRCITINLDPALENPASRTFKNPHILLDLHRERAKYISAALTIIRAWIVAGRPKSDCKALSSYEDWSDLCRQPLLWLELPDPTEAVFAAMNDDPDRETLGRLLQAWHATFGSAPKMIRDAVNKADEAFNDELKEVICDIAAEKGVVNRRILGRWVKRNASRIVNGMRFVRASGNRSAEAWRVELVSSVSPVSSSIKHKSVAEAQCDDGSDLV